jgi:hypothetical protein
MKAKAQDLVVVFEVGVGRRRKFELGAGELDDSEIVKVLKAIYVDLEKVRKLAVVVYAARPSRVIAIVIS